MTLVNLGVATDRGAIIALVQAAEGVGHSAITKALKAQQPLAKINDRTWIASQRIENFTVFATTRGNANCAQTLELLQAVVDCMNSEPAPSDVDKLHYQLFMILSGLFQDGRPLTYNSNVISAWCADDCVSTKVWTSNEVDSSATARWRKQELLIAVEERLEGKTTPTEVKFATISGKVKASSTGLPSQHCQVQLVVPPNVYSLTAPDILVTNEDYIFVASEHPKTLLTYTSNEVDVIPLTIVSNVNITGSDVCFRIQLNPVLVCHDVFLTFTLPPWVSDIRSTKGKSFKKKDDGSVDWRWARLTQEAQLELWMDLFASVPQFALDLHLSYTCYNATQVKAHQLHLASGNDIAGKVPKVVRSSTSCAFVHSIRQTIQY